MGIAFFLAFSFLPAFFLSLNCMWPGVHEPRARIGSVRPASPLLPRSVTDASRAMEQKNSKLAPSSRPDVTRPGVHKECEICTSHQAALIAYSTSTSAKAAAQQAKRAILATMDADKLHGDVHKLTLAGVRSVPASPPDAEALYECDDRCGSFWQKLPVDISGRYAKDTVNHVFSFAVQANVICVIPEGFAPPGT